MTLDLSQRWDDVAPPQPGGEAAPRLRPRAPRTTKVMLVGKLMVEGCEQLCRVLNIAVGGLMMSTASPLRPEQRIRIELKNGRELAGTTVWSNPPCSGVRFDAPIDIEQMLASYPAATGCPLHVPRAPRLTANRIALIRCSGRTLPAQLLDLSQGGAKIRLTASLAPGDQLSITVPPHLPATGTVRWTRDREAGIAFFDVLSLEQVAQWLADPRICEQ